MRILYAYTKERTRRGITSAEWGGVGWYRNRKRTSVYARDGRNGGNGAGSKKQNKLTSAETLDTAETKSGGRRSPEVGA